MKKVLCTLKNQLPLIYKIEICEKQTIFIPYVNSRFVTLNFFFHIILLSGIILRLI